MSLEERDGTLDLVSDKGILLSGDRLSYSKWFEGDRPTQDSVGCTVRVLLDVGDKVSFLKRILAIGGKSVGWKPPEPGKKGFFGGGGGRRFSPEELDLKKEEGVRIARSVAIDRAITMIREGIPIEKIADLALAVEHYLLKGTLPPSGKAPLPKVPPQQGADVPQSNPPSKAVQASTPFPEPPKKDVPSPKAKPKRLTPQVVNDLFNKALRGGIVMDWQDYTTLVQTVLKVKGKTPYQMSQEDYAVVENLVQSRLSRSSAA